MGTITFHDGERSRTVSVAPPSTTSEPIPQRRATLLQLARANGVPLLFSCESGDCGACRVEVSYPEGRPATVQPPTPSEALHQAASRLANPPPPGAEIRLACQYRPGGETMLVTFPLVLGAL